MENSNGIIYKENNTILKSVSINNNNNNILCVGGQDFLKTYTINIKENSIKQNYQFSMSKKISFKTLFSNKSQLFSTGINKNILGNKGFFDIIDFENNSIISQYNYDCQSILNFDQSTNNDIFALGSADGKLILVDQRLNNNNNLLSINESLESIWDVKFNPFKEYEIVCSYSENCLICFDIRNINNELFMKQNSHNVILKGNY